MTLLIPGGDSLYRYEETDPLEASTGWQTVTASGSTHTKGNWATLITSTAFEVFEIEVYLADNNATVTNTACLVDIGIGANPNEVVIIPNLNGGMAGPVSTTTMNAKGFRFPLYIPSGVRIAARCQHVTGSSTIKCRATVRGRARYPGWVGQLVTDYGTDSANSRGQAVTAGSAAEGSWAQITSSVSRTARWVAWGIGQNADTTVQGSSYFGDLALGASTAEVEISTESWVGSSTTAELEVGYEPSGRWLDVPSGQRLSARLYGTTAQALDVIIYGVS